MRPAEPFLHVDLDAFYAGVEVLKDPSLRGKPVIVGGTGARGVVASASYEARVFGVHSAMPAVRARRLCPDGIFLPRGLRGLPGPLQPVPRGPAVAHTPLVEPISLDEAFLDVGGATTLFGAPPTIAAKIRADVEREVGVTCSVGVASTKFVAKLASDLCKPDGMLHVESAETLAFLEPLPVGRLWGVGEKTARPARTSRRSARSGTWRGPRGPCWSACSARPSAAHLSELSRGIDEREVVPYEAPKSVGHEETFEHDLDDDEEILRELLHLSGRVAARLREDGYRARTVNLKARLASFTTLTRAKTLSGSDRRRLGSVSRGGGALPGAARRAPPHPSARRVGQRAGPGRRGAALAAPRRPLGRRRADDRPDRGQVRERRGETGRAPGPGPRARRRRFLPSTGGAALSSERSRARRLEVPLMPLNDHEQRILDEIERQLAEDDPSFADQVGRTDLYTHLTRRIRLAAGAFLVGLVMLFLFVISVWFAVGGFLVMLLSAVLIYRYLGMLGRDQIRAMQAEGGGTIGGFLGRIASRFRRS